MISKLHFPPIQFIVECDIRSVIWYVYCVWVTTIQVLVVTGAQHIAL